MKEFLSHIKKYRIYAMLSPLLMVLEVGTDIIIPYLMAKIIDIGVANRDMDYIIKIGSLMILAAILGIIFGIMSAHFGAKAGYGFAAEIREETFKKIQGFSFANLDQFSISSLVTRLTNDANRIGQVTMMSLRMGVRAPFLMVFALIMAININASLAIIFGITIPLTIVLTGFLLYKARPLFMKIQEKVDNLNAIIKENLAGIGVVKAFNRQEFEKSKFKERNDDLLEIALKAISIIIFAMPLLNLIIYSTIVAVLWFGGQQIIAGTMNSGDLMSFITYITQIMMALMMMSMFLMQFLRGVASKDRILEVWNTSSEINEIENPLTKIVDGSIRFENVNFSYLNTKEFVLKDINLEINSGETVGIIGSTGSSKSSLVQLIPRLYDVNEGSVFVANNNVKDYDLKVLRDQVAFVLQKNTLFSGTIRSNMLWGNEDATDFEIVEALRKAQAYDFVCEYKDGLDHEVLQHGDNFSGGQKQRLTIARVLLKNPKIIVLDDSTSAVDMDTDAKIQKVFKEQLSDITTIIIAQRIASIKNADKIIVMDQGKIESIGSHKQLLETSQIYKEIYESQEKGVVRE